MRAPDNDSPFSLALHFRCASRRPRVPGRARCSTSCAGTRPKRSISSATSSTAGSSSPAGSGRRRITTWCRSFCGKARKGARVVYVPGNHDEFLRDYLRHPFRRHRGGRERDPCRRRRAALPRDPWRPLRPRGDAGALARARLAARPTTMRSSSTESSTARRRLGFPYWSLSQWAKLKVKNAVNYIGEFEKTLVAEAKRHGVDGVICGHIHHAAIHEDFGIRYLNCGDWVENCTAIVEHMTAASRSSPGPTGRSEWTLLQQPSCRRERRRHNNDLRHSRGESKLISEWQCRRRVRMRRGVAPAPAADPRSR